MSTEQELNPAVIPDPPAAADAVANSASDDSQIHTTTTSIDQRPSGPRHERRSTVGGSNTMASIKTTIPHEFQIVERILSLFKDPEMIMRFTFEMKSNPNVPFYRQGDLRTVETGKKEARMKILQNRAVRRAIDRFWELFKFKDVRYGVSREQYVEFHQLVSRTLRSDSHDVTQTQGVAARDWLHDCSSNHGIQLDAWRQSMFELVDLWEVGSDPISYVAFLDTLLSRIAEPVTPIHIHRAIAKSWKPSVTTSNGRLLRWALANVELKFRALKEVPKPKLAPNCPSLYSADLEFREDAINQGETHQPKKPVQGGNEISQPVVSQVDEKVLARLEEFLTEDDHREVRAEDTIIDMVQILADSRARFASYLQKKTDVLKLSLESCNKIHELNSEAQRVRKLFETSAAYQEREKERPPYSTDLRKASDDIQWEILTRNGFVDAVLKNEMLPRMCRLWNNKPENSIQP